MDEVDDCGCWVKIDTVADLAAYIDNRWAQEVVELRECGIPDSWIEVVRRRWYEATVECLPPRIVAFLSDKEHREAS